MAEMARTAPRRRDRMRMCRKRSTGISGAAPRRCGRSTTRIHPRGFRQFLDYANGQLGDWGIHWIDQAMWIMDAAYPKTIFSTGGRPIKGPPVNSDAGQTTDAPDHQVVNYAFDDFTLTWEHRQFAGHEDEKTEPVGAKFYGSKGVFDLGWQSGWTFYPADGSPPAHQNAVFSGETNSDNIPELWARLHRRDQTKRRPVCDIEIGHRATSAALLGMISLKLGRSVRWDGEKQTILDDPQAAELLRRPYRGPWKYPANLIELDCISPSRGCIYICVEAASGDDRRRETAAALCRQGRCRGVCRACSALCRHGLRHRSPGDRHRIASAEDVAQDCFLRLAQGSSAISGSLAAWLHRTSLNRSLELLRSERARQRREAQIAANSVASSDAADVEAAELVSHVDEALAALPDELRVVVTEHFLCGKSQSDIAAALRLSQPTVSRRIDKGLSELRRWLKDQGWSTAAGAVLPLGLR